MSDMTPKFSLGAVADFLADRFGGIVRTRATTVTAGLAAVIAAQSDPERVSLTFINLGAAEVFLAPSTLVSNILGIRLGANGGAVSFNVLEDGDLSAQEWSALATGAANSLAVFQVTREAMI